jgi:hypothetical protein
MATDMAKNNTLCCMIRGVKLKKVSFIGIKYNIYLAVIPHTQKL